MKPLAAHLLPPPEPHRVSITRTFPIFGDTTYADELLSYADKYRHYEIGGQGFFRARQSTAVGPHFLVITRHRLLMAATSRGRKSRARTPVLQRMQKRYTIADSATTRQFDGPVIVIGGKASGQFFHWITEVVPRLTMVKAAFRKRTPPVLVRPLHQKYQRETLSILGLEVIEVDEDVVSAPEILVPSHMVLPIGRGCLSPDLIPLSQQFASAARAPRGHGQRIYISRNDSLKTRRRVDNEQDVMDLLGAYGFRRVLLSELSLVEQIGLFRSAEAVIGPHGAGLVSTVYCRPKTKVVELWPLGFPAVSPFWNIASLADLDYAMCVCSAGLDEAGRFDLQGMTADLGLLRTVLDRLRIEPRRSASERKKARAEAKHQQIIEAVQARQERRARQRQALRRDARRMAKQAAMKTTRQVPSSS